MAVNTESIPPSHTNGVIEDGYDEDEKMKVRPADIDADMREMERRKRVELIMNSRLFREELERIIESQIKAGNSSAGLLQQISDMVGSKYSGVNNHLFRGASCAVPINDIRGVEAMGYAKGEKILRCKLAALFRLIDLYGWSQGIYNHVTARLSQQEEHFLVNPYGLLYSEVTASSLVKVDMQGSVIESGTTNFSVNVTGFQLHAAIYAARPDLKCIVHLHTPSVLAISSLKDGLLPICQEAAVIGEISHHSYIGIPNEPEERDKIVRNLGPNNKVIFLTNHGALCCGETIEETFFYACNTVNACETQLKVLPLGKDNLVLLSDETRKSMYDASRKIPENISPPVSNVPSAAAATEKRWRIGGLEFEALMRMLDNAGFRTGYVYRQPLIKGELPRPRNDVEVPPAVSSLGYLFEEEELYKGQWKKAFGGKGNDRIRWLNSPNVYQKVEILETGTSDPKKITKWVDANNEEWVADGSPSHTSTPVKIENALQFVPKNTNPKEFKKLQQQIKDNRRADKITSGPQSHILEGVSWEEAKKLQDANISGTSDQVILVGAASKGIIQREYQHNATVYKTPYAKNPFDAVTDEEIENYKKDITRKQRGDSYYDEDESDALSSSLPPSGKRQNTGITSETEDESLTHEMRVIQIETTTVPKASQAEVVLSDDKANRKLSKSQAATKAFIKDKYNFYSEELRKFIVRIWEVKKMRPILKTIGESMTRPVYAAIREKEYDSSSPPTLSYPSGDGGKMNEMFKQIVRELVTRFKQGSIFKQRSVRPAFLPVAIEAPEFHDVSLKSASFDCSDTEITTLIELPWWQRDRRYSGGSLGSVHDFSSDPTTEDEEDEAEPRWSPENDAEKTGSLLSLSSYIGHEFENPEESNEMLNTSTTKIIESDDTSFDDVTVICKQKDDEAGKKEELDDAEDEKNEFSDASLSSELMQDEDDDEVADVEWNTYESLNDVDEDYFEYENGAAKPTTANDECVTSFVEKTYSATGTRYYKPELAVIYEESHVSDSKCSLKSILDDSCAIFAQPQCALNDVIIADSSQPQCERSDTPDTYVIEEEPCRADHLDDDVWERVQKCIAYADALLKHVKNVKIDRIDLETVSSPMANFAASDVNGTAVDSDAHTISESSLISCLADSTEYLEALKNDSCSLDVKDESSERVSDSGILIEDAITCSSEGDYTDMKLYSDVFSAEIGAVVLPSNSRASSGSDEAEDAAVWITQIERIFDFDVDDFCLNILFAQADELAAQHELVEQSDRYVDEEVSDFGLVFDSEPSARHFTDFENNHSFDSVTQNDDHSFDSVIGSDHQSQQDHSVDDELSPSLCTFRDDAENMPARVLGMDNEHLGSIPASILINELYSDSDHLAENCINAEVTAEVPETISVACNDGDPQTVPDSVVVVSETSSLSSPIEHNVESNVSNENSTNTSQQSCNCNSSDVHLNCEICEFIKGIAVADRSKVAKSLVQNTDFSFDLFDSVMIRILAAENQLPCGVNEKFVEYKNVAEVFGESFLNDSNFSEISRHESIARQDIFGGNVTDVEKIPTYEEFETDINIYDDSSYICLDCNLIAAAADDTVKSSMDILDIAESTIQLKEDEENTSCVNDEAMSRLSTLLDWNGVLCKTTTDDSIMKNISCEDGIRAPQTEKYDRSAFENADLNNAVVLVGDETIIVECGVKTLRNVVHQEAESDDKTELPSQLLESGVELDADTVSEGNNDCIPINGSNYSENREIEAAASDGMCELEASADSSENNDDVTVVEMVVQNSFESCGKIDSNGSSPQHSDLVELLEKSDDIVAAEDNDVVSESSESTESETENIDETVTTTNDNDVSRPSECVELDEYADTAATLAQTDTTSNLSEFCEISENSEDESSAEIDFISKSIGIIDDHTAVKNDATYQVIEMNESPENSVDDAIIENNPIHESSESAESTDMIDDAAVTVVHNNLIEETSKGAESAEISDDFDRSHHVIVSDMSESMAKNVDRISLKNGVIDQSSEMIDLAENSDHRIAIVENDIRETFEYEESIEAVDSSITAQEDDFHLESTESVVKSFSYIAIQNPPESTVESMENVPTQDCVINQLSKITESSTENNDDQISIVKKNIAREYSEIEEPIDAIDEVGIAPPKSGLESSECSGSIAESDSFINQDSLESTVENVNNLTVENYVVFEPLEHVELAGNVEDVALAGNDVICEPEEYVESVKSLDNNSEYLATAEENIIQEPLEPVLVEPTSTLHDVDNMRNSVVNNQSQLTENDSIHGDGDFVAVENNLVSTQLIDSITVLNDSSDKNHLEYDESALVHNERKVSISNHSISCSIGSETNAEICSVLGYLNERNFFGRNIAAGTAACAIAIEASTLNVNEKDEIANSSSNETRDENYVTISDASSSKPEDDRERESSSSSQTGQNFVTVSEASTDKSESSVSQQLPKDEAAEKAKPTKSNPDQRKSRSNVKTRVRFTNRKSVKRTSPSQKKESTDEDDCWKGGIGASDEKKQKIESSDVTEYSVKLKLHIEWDNKRSSSDSTSKSSSFDDSLNCSESTSEGKRDIPEKDNNNNVDGAGAEYDTHQPCYRHRFEQVTRLLTDFKNEYPKFVTYEYFSPKVQIRTTPKKKTADGDRRTTTKNTVRKSLSLDSSPSGRYHRYCHISSRDLNVVDNKSTNSSKCTSVDAIITPKRNTCSSFVKNIVNQTTNMSRNRINRKTEFKSRNRNDTSSSMKTSTPVLTAAGFVTKESVIESLTSNTLSPIVNSLEEFELLESLLTSCEN